MISCASYEDFMEPADNSRPDLPCSPAEDTYSSNHEENLILWFEDQTESDPSSPEISKDLVPFVEPSAVSEFTPSDTSILGEDLSNKINEFQPEDITSVIYDLTSKLETFSLDRKLVQINTSIQDKSQKWFVSENNALYARRLQGENIKSKDQYTVTLYDRKKKPSVTFKLKDQDLYLAYQSDKLELKKMTEEELQNDNTDTDMFFFYIRNTTNTTYSFNPSLFPNLCLCTTEQENVQVTVQPKSENRGIVDFVLDSRIYGSHLENVPVKRQGLFVVFKWLPRG